MRGLAGPSRHPKARVPPGCPLDPRQYTCNAVSNHTTTSESHRRGALVSQGAEPGGQHAADAQAVAALQRAAGGGAGGRRPRWRRRRRGGRDEDTKPRPAHWQQPAQVAEHDASPRGPQGGLNRQRMCSQAPFKFKFRCVCDAGGRSAKMPQVWRNELGGRGAATADERSTDSILGAVAKVSRPRQPLLHPSRHASGGSAEAQRPQQQQMHGEPWQRFQPSLCRWRHSVRRHSSLLKAAQLHTCLPQSCACRPCRGLTSRLGCRAGAAGKEAGGGRAQKRRVGQRGRGGLPRRLAHEPR